MAGTFEVADAVRARIQSHIDTVGGQLFGIVKAFFLGNRDRSANDQRPFLLLETRDNPERLTSMPRRKNQQLILVLRIVSGEAQVEGKGAWLGNLRLRDLCANAIEKEVGATLSDLTFSGAMELMEVSDEKLASSIGAGDYETILVMQTMKRIQAAQR